MAMDSLREQALAPLSRSDAERLLPELSTGRQTLERRVLRARCLKYLESFDIAWSELNAVLPLITDPLLKARVAVDLLHLSYYLVRRDDAMRFKAIAQPIAAGDPLVLAELHLGSSIVNTAANEVPEGERLARQSGTGASEDHGHIALLRGETEVADLILTRAPKGMPDDEQFRDFVRAIVIAQKGDPRKAVRVLEQATREFEARGMDHWAIGAAVHAAFWRESIVRGGGTSRAVPLVRDIGTRGGEGFAYYLPDVAAWLGRAVDRDPQARALGHIMRARAESAERRAKADAGEGAGASALDEATFGLRAIGLTWREIGILREMEQLSREGRRLDRDQLAGRLGVSPNTLRVHLTRIRAKLDVVDKRGDEVILEAALSRRPGLVGT